MLQQRGWMGSVPREPGGPLPPSVLARLATAFRPSGAKTESHAPILADAGGRACADPNCGGPRFCLHRFMDKIDARAVAAWRTYDLPLPVPADQLHLLDGARACVEALVHTKAHPRDMARCGADAERLAVLGYTADGLVRGRGLPFEQLCEGLGLTWPRLVALGWHPSLLKHRDAYAAVTLADASITAADVLGTFAVGFDELYETGLTTEELLVLGFDGPLLAQIGLRREQVAAMVLQPGVMARGGAPWLCRALRLTPALWRRLPVTAPLIAGNPDLQSACASLTMHLASAARAP